MPRWTSIRVPESAPQSSWTGQRTYRVALENDKGEQIDAHVTIDAEDDKISYSRIVSYAPRNKPIFPIDPNDFPYVSVNSNHLIQQVRLNSPYKARYLDLKGAPWAITVDPLDNLKLITVRATSGGYEGASLESRSLEDLVKKIDDFSLTHFRLNPTLQKSDVVTDPVQPFIGQYKDEAGTLWLLHDLRDESRGVPGFYGRPDVFGDFRLVGPSSSLNQLYQDVKNFNQGKAVFGLNAASRTSSVTSDTDAPVTSSPSTDKEKAEAWYNNPWVWVLGGGGLLLTLGVFARATAPKATPYSSRRMLPR